MLRGLKQSINLDVLFLFFSLSLGINFKFQHVRVSPSIWPLCLEKKGAFSIFVMYSMLTK